MLYEQLFLEQLIKQSRYTKKRGYYISTKIKVNRVRTRWEYKKENCSKPFLGQLIRG